MIAAKDAGLDDTTRGDLIDFYTFGETRSSKELDEKQADDLFKIIQQIRRGRADIRYSPDGKLFLEAPGGGPVRE